MVSYQTNPHFTGRDELLCELRAKLVEVKPKRYNHRVSIYGLGGVGKTQVAIEYIYRYEQEYKAIFWISAADQAVLFSGFESIAKMIDIPTIDQKPEDIAKGVLSWLRGQESWLLVVDNLDDVSVAKGYLPDMVNNGHTIITTRNPDYLQFPAEGMEIPTLGEDAAIEMVRLRTGRENGEFTPTEVLHAREIVRELGCLALAIEQASAFIRLSLRDISNFLPIYRTARKKLLDRNSPGDSQYPISLFATVLISFQRLQAMEYGPNAMNFLRLLAFLNPDGILMEFLQEGCSGLSDTLREIITNQYVFHETLGALQQLSLVSKSKAQDSIIIHRLIQAITQENMSTEMHAEYQNAVLALCDTVIPKHENAFYGKFKRLQHQIIEPVFQASAIWTPAKGSILARFGYFLCDDGRYSDSERFFKLNLNQQCSLLGGDYDKAMLSDMSNLASTYMYQGKLKESADLNEKVLAARKRILGEEHPHTLTTMSNLASTYGGQGKLKESADLKEKVLAARKRILGEEHPHTLTTMSNLASTYRGQGRLKESADLNEKVLAIRKRILGEEHPDTLTTMSNLASTYGGQGKLKESADLKEKVLAARKRILGEEHPSTLTTMSNLALTYGGQGKLKESADLKEKVLAASKRILGEEHPDTLTIMNNTASTYRDQGRLKESADLNEKVLAARKRILGEEHPDTLTTMSNLALTYGGQGKLKESADLKEKVLAASKRILGEEHPDTLTTMSNLASTYRDQGRLKESADLKEKVLADKQEDPRRGASRHTDDHEQSGLNIPGSRETEGIGGSEGESPSNMQEDPRRGASTHTDDHEQSGLNIRGSRETEGIGGSERESPSSTQEDPRRGASTHTDDHEQSGLNIRGSRETEGIGGSERESSSSTQEDPRRGASTHTDDHEQSGLNIRGSRETEGIGGSERESSSSTQEDPRRGASRHTDDHEQYGLNIPGSRETEGIGGSERESSSSTQEDPRRGASRHTDDHEQSGHCLSSPWSN